MLAWLIASVALAQSQSDAAIRTAMSSAAKRTLSKDSVCIARPEVPEVFGDVAAVGMRENAEGCVLKGVMIRGKLRTPELGASVAKIDAGWKILSKEERGQALAAWTHGVLTAFGNHTGEATASVGKGKAVVTQQWLHRAGAGGLAALSTETVTFDLDSGEVLDRSSAAEQYFRTAFSTRPEELTGNLTTDIVSKALSSQGRPIKRCFRDHWEADLTYEGRLIVEWSVKDGKAGDFAVVSQDPPMDLLKCYVNYGIREVQWPAEAQGTAQWVFWARRSQVEAP